MSKLRLKKIDESAGSIVTAFFHKKKVEDSRFSAPSQEFDFLYIGTYPLQRRVFVWKEGIYTCILFSLPSNDNKTSLIVVGGMKTSALEMNMSPKYILANLDWKFTKKDTYPDTLHASNSLINYIANQIKIKSGLICSGFPDGWQLDITSKTLSINVIINNLSI
jgi:hypothetical protein